MKIKKRKLELQEHASLYHSMGCNIFCIGSQVNIYNCHEGNILKSPNHAYNKLFEERQSSEDLNSFDWGNATGVGIILGFNNIVALDIDGSSNLGLVNEILEILNLPLDYEWVMKSGSRIGYHIILKCEDIDPFYEAKNVSNLEEAQLILNAPNFGQLDTNAYYPKFYIRPFCKLEFKWRGNLAMPPSLHVTGERYVFAFGVPKFEPRPVEFLQLKRIKDKYCSLQANISEALNTRFVTYHSPADKDEVIYNFERRKKEPLIVLGVCNYKIIYPNDIADEEIRSKYIVQMCWFVLDRNYNVVKRKTYNYFNRYKPSEELHNYIKYEDAEKIITDKRKVFLELLYDMMHVNGLAAKNVQELKYIIEEGLDVGIYLEDHLKTQVESLEIILEERELKSNNTSEMLYKKICEYEGLILYNQHLYSKRIEEENIKRFNELLESEFGNYTNSNIMSLVLVKLIANEINIR